MRAGLADRKYSTYGSRNQSETGPFNSYAGISVNLSKNWSVLLLSEAALPQKHR